STDPTQLTLTIPPTVTVSGIVRDASGSPIAGMPMRFGESSANLYGAQDTTAANGAYSVRIPPGSYWMSPFWGMGYDNVGNEVYAFGKLAAPLVIAHDAI